MSMIGQEEKKAIELLLPYLSDKPVIFDVGANKGDWSDVIMETIPNCRVYFFEASLVLIHYLWMKYDYHDNPIEFVNMAVSNEDDHNVPFYYFTNRNNGLSSLYDNPRWDYLPKQKTIVTTITIDKYCKRNKIDYIDFLKIDVEGSECDVFNGMRFMLNNKRIGIVQIEYSEHYQVASCTFEYILKACETYGYQVYLFDNEKFIPVTSNNFVEDFGFRNYFITRELIADTQDCNRPFIESVVGLPKVELAMEIGCFEGKTTRYIHDNMLVPGGRVVCVDPLEDKYFTEDFDEYAINMNEKLHYFKNQYIRFLRNTRNLHMNLYRTTIMGAYPEIKHLRFGFIYVDGDHREKAVNQDAIISFELCMVGGYILFDDYTWSEGTKRGIDRFLAAFEKYIEIVKMDYQVLIKRIA